MSSYSFGDGILPPIKRKPATASLPPASEMAQGSAAPLAGPMASQHVAVLEGVGEVQEHLGTVINLAQKREQKFDPKKARIDSAFREVKASLPTPPSGGAPRIGVAAPTGAGQQQQPGGTLPPCMSVCDLVYIIEAAKRSRGVTVNWQHANNKPMGLGAQQLSCQLVTLTAVQVNEFAPRAQQILTSLGTSAQEIAACVAGYCRDYACDVPGVRQATVEQVCQLVFAIKAAQYGKTYTALVNGVETALSPAELKQRAPTMAATLKTMLDKGITTPDVVASCEKKYCEQYGCGTGGGGGGGGGGEGGSPGCPEGQEYDIKQRKCVPIEGPVAQVDTKKSGFGWLVAAGIAATLAKKVLFVTALAGAPKLVELEDEDEE